MADSEEDMKVRSALPCSHGPSSKQRSLCCRAALQAQVEEVCKPHCIKPLLAYQACAKRIEVKHNGHCTGQYFDYWYDQAPAAVAFKGDCRC